MEEFLNLDWSWRRIHSTQEIEVNFSYDEKDVFMCHLNEIDHIHLLDSYGKYDLASGINHQNIDPRTGKEVAKQLIDHSKRNRTRLYPNFPQRSSMNSKEHQFCLNALSKLKCDQGTFSMSDRKDMRIYAQLFDQRRKEKIEFLEFVKSEFYKRNIKNCYNLHPELEKFVTKRWTDSIENVKLSNDSCYQLQSALPLNQTDHIDEISIEFEKILDQSGVVMAIDRNKYLNSMQLSCSFLNNFFTNDVQVPIPLEHFLLNEKVDIVVSLKTLSSILISSGDLSKNWNLTFSLKEYNDNKVIVFDEILPSMPFECIEKNRKADAYGLTASMVVHTKQVSFSLKENCFEHQQEQQDFDEQHESILSIDPVSTYSVLPFDEYLNKINSRSGDLTDPNPTIHSSNHTYRSWKIKKNSSDYFRMIIGSSQDVCEKQSDGTVQFINLSPKLDYQCEFGAEQMNFSELISEWCQLRFGPNTITDRVRIDPITSGIMDVAQITVDDVECDLNRLFNVNKEYILDPLLNLVKIINNFPPNEYMLRHESKNGNQAMVYMKCDDKSSSVIRVADIYESKRLDTTNLEIVPWNPIDDMICTVIHKQSNVMPCAFPPWGESRKVNTNDRQRLVEKAKKKTNERKQKTAAISKMYLINKYKKKLRRRKEKKEILAKQLTLQGESMDPNELFDEQGNIQLLNFVTSNKKPADTNENDKSSLKPICYESYVKDAGMNCTQNDEIVTD